MLIIESLEFEILLNNKIKHLLIIVKQSGRKKNLFPGYLFIISGIEGTISIDSIHGVKL